MNFGLVLTVLAVVVGGCGGPPSRGGTPSDSVLCLPLPGDDVTATAWSPTGDLLAVLTSDRSDGHAAIRLVTWPGLKVEEVQTGPSADPYSGVGIDGGGRAYWFEAAPDPSIWSTRAGESATRYAVLPSPDIVDLAWTADGLVAQSTGREGGVEKMRVIRITPHGSELATVRSLYDSPRILTGVWASPDGEWLAIEESDEPGGAAIFTALHGSDRSTLIPAGRLVGNPMMPMKRDGVVYEDHSSGSLVAMSFGSSTPRTVLQVDARALSLSNRGVLAFGRLDFPERGLCFADVGLVSAAGPVSP